MTATLERVLAGFRAELGTVEKPAGSNRVRYSRAYGLVGPWCHMFISVVARERGAGDIIPWAAYTPAGAAWFRDRKRYGRTPQRGAIVYYRFPGMDRISHVGVVEAVHGDGTITAIEGNTDAAGGRTGGKVMRRRRSMTLVDGFGYPQYQSPAAAAKATKARKAKAKKVAQRGGAATVLLAVGAGGGAVVRPTPPPKPAPAIVVTARPSATSTGTATRRPVLTRTLRYRPGPAAMRGNDVAAVQRLVGLRGKAVTGVYDLATAAAVKRWQARNVKATGVFGHSAAGAAGWKVP